MRFCRSNVRSENDATEEDDEDDVDKGKEVEEGPFCPRVLFKYLAAHKDEDRTVELAAVAVVVAAFVLLRRE